MNIAPLQKKKIDSIRDVLSDLEKLSNLKSNSRLADIKTRFKNCATRVAIIGQVKSGKSTFLNAFLGETGLFPTDVNPWTSAITNLRINVPGDPTQGASFEFFDDHDWKRITEESPEAFHKLAEMLPGFDSEVLKNQGLELQSAAKKRLGKHYDVLLGSKHEYDFLTPDLMGRYVCVGVEADGSEATSSSGRYSALTKQADIYMRKPEFLSPIIISDTPGVNDPFLVRDEYTCRNLDIADIYLMVLSVHQALTNVDLALLNTLSAQDDKHIIIFINRIDELSRYETEVPEVIGDVTLRLSKAIPTSNFTVIAGSAYLGAHLSDGHKLEDILEPEQLDAYLDAVGAGGLQTDEEKIARFVGLDAVKREISGLMDSPRGTQRIDRLARDIDTEVNSLKLSARREHETIEAHLNKVESNNVLVAVSEINQEIELVREVAAKFEDLKTSAESQAQSMILDARDLLDAQFHKEIQTFVETQKEIVQNIFLGANGSGDKPVGFEIDILPIGASIRELASKAYDDARERIDAVVAAYQRASLDTISSSLGEQAKAISLDDLPNRGFSSSLVLKKKSLEATVYLRSSWEFWKKNKVDVDQSMSAIQTLMKDELYNGFVDLLNAFAMALSERFDTAMSKVSVSSRLAESQVKKYISLLERDKKTLTRLMESPKNLSLLSDKLRKQRSSAQSKLDALTAIENKVSYSTPLSA